MKKPALYVSLALLLLTACNEALMEPQKMGSISLSLSSDVEVTADTKTGADAVDCSDFLVDIYGTTTFGQQYSTPQYIYASMPSEVSLPFGQYRVSAQNCLEDAAEEGFGCVRYYGESALIDVSSKATEDVTVSCKMVNGKVRMTFDESFLEDFSDVTLKMTCSREVTLTSDEANLPADVYFNVPEEGCTFIYTIKGTISKGTENERELTYTNGSDPMTLLPARWIKITIKSNHNGIIGPGVDVDGEMDDDSFTQIINPEDGTDVVNGEAGLPSIIVDTRIDKATVVDCVIEVH